MAPEVTEFNKDELEAPAWMNAEFFTTVLKHCTAADGDDIKVKSFKMTPATAKGDHYASVMFRGTVEYCNGRGDAETKSLIIKTMPEIEGHKKELLGESYIFETEIGMYSDVIPKVEAVLNEAGDPTKIGAPCLYHSLSPKKIIVFEDIVPHGYIVIRERNINADEVKGAYTKLAKMHAVSLKMVQEEPACFDTYRHNIMTMDSMKKSPFVMNGIKHFIEMLESQSSLQEYVKYFEPIKDDLIDRVRPSFVDYWSNRRDDTVYVLCHGDFHGKNMMFNFGADGKYEDVLLLDFQMSYMGSFVLDLMYSVFMLADKEMRCHRMGELFAHYLQEFNETADTIGYAGRRPELKDLLEQFKIHRHWLIFLMATFLPMWNPFKKGEIEPDDLMKSEDCQKAIYKEQEFIDEMHVLLPKYKALGYFDDL